MKTTALALSLIAATALAAEVPSTGLGPRVDAQIRQAIPVCSGDATVTVDDLRHALPDGLTGKVVRIESKRQACSGQFIAVTSREGDFFWGLPWFLDGFTGPLEARLKDFGWKNLQQSYDATVDPQRTRDGLQDVTLYQTTEHGRVPIAGEIDPAGTVFFIGRFHPLDAGYIKSRLKTFQPFTELSPTTGASDPAVTIIEFSDFECPSCRIHSGNLEPILEKYGKQVRYIRYDFPLMSLHPWAFAAAVDGRAIWRQSPSAFWDFKKQVYASQDDITAFTLDSFVRGFLQDHRLDQKKFDVDVNSPDLQKTILDGVGAAFANDILATPTYLVNGISVDPGDDGKALEAYVAKLLKAK